MLLDSNAVESRTQLCFVFLNFSFMCVKISSVGLKLDRARCTMSYFYSNVCKRAKSAFNQCGQMYYTEDN